MASYKQTVLDIKDFVSFGIAECDRCLDRVDIVYTQRVTLEAEKQAYKDILAIIKEGEKDA